MDEGQKKDRRGTFWDWPVGWIVGGLVLAVLFASNGAGGGAVIGIVMAAFGALTFLARRGSFSPRGR